jgi:hypothetical protein
MRKPAIIAIALAGALALPGAARAKEITKVQVCGASGCAGVPRGDDGFGAFMDGGLPADPPERAGGWYRIRYTIAEGSGADAQTFEFRNVYVPGSNRLRVRDQPDEFGWYEPPPELALALRSTLRRVDAFPAAQLRGLDAVRPETPPAVADATPAASARPTTRAAADDGGSAPWTWVALAVAALTAAAVALTALAARARRPGAA